VSVDAIDRESVKSLLAATIHARGKADILVNCAGVNSSVPYFEIPDDDFDKVLDTNLKSTHLGCQVFGAHMAEHGAVPSSTSGACRPTSHCRGCSSTPPPRRRS